MIRSFSHKGLEKLFKDGNAAGVRAIHVRKLKQILVTLNEARTIADIDAPGCRLHCLRGSMAEFWSVTVQSNWRVTFRMVDNDVHVVDDVDYH